MKRAIADRPCGGIATASASQVRNKISIIIEGAAETTLRCCKSKTLASLNNSRQTHSAGGDRIGEMLASAGRFRDFVDLISKV